MNDIEEKELSTKELILNVTLELIKKEGFEDITVRKIAALANVNVALVNYYFGSKDKLLNTVIHTLVSSFQNSFAILDDTSLDPRDRLKHFLLQYVKAYQQYPFIARKLVNQEPLAFESQNEFVNFLKSIGLVKMKKIVRELTGEKDEHKITIMVSHLLGAIFLPILIEPLYETVTGYPFSDIETQVDILLDRYFVQ